MKFLKYYILFLSLFSCGKNDKNIIKYGYTNENFQVSIFDKLFTGIHIDPDKYKNIDGYTIKEESNNHYLLPDKTIIVESESFRIIYWPNYENDDMNRYIPHLITIYKKTNECILGESIGENIETFAKKYIDKIEGVYKYETFTHYSYGYKKNATSTRSIFVGLNVKNNLIYEINYGYEQ